MTADDWTLVKRGIQGFTDPDNPTKALDALARLENNRIRPDEAVSYVDASAYLEATAEICRLRERIAELENKT